eukprot:c2006_g1_i1.p1 GENE.c2006_g1_i1~~c2006_g1_i1.p1  ORF type:complete len:145 (-),score=42.05 c2006_g1_i1:295-690(-)
MTATDTSPNSSVTVTSFKRPPVFPQSPKQAQQTVSPQQQADGALELGVDVVVVILDSSPGKFATFTGKDIKATIELTKTVGDLKYLIYETQGLLVEHQEIMFCGKKLDDASTLESHHVIAHSKLYVVNVHN